MRTSFKFAVAIFFLWNLSPAATWAGSFRELIPQPKVYNTAEGVYRLHDKLTVSINTNERKSVGVVRYFINMLSRASGDQLQLLTDDGSADIAFEIVAGGTVPAEGYELAVNAEGVMVRASKPAGLFYAVQTIRQLFPPEIETEGGLSLDDMQLPFVHIADSPRFPWRGFMLDESRHFFGRETVLELIDRMAFYKLNRFHWHLTDTDGWRIEIEGYPRLTSVGGRGDRTNPDGPAQYYTQEDIREIVAYAADRFITIVPEIDMPGHAAAANRAYPEFSGGGSSRHPEFTFNPAKPETIQFLKDVLRQVAELFPGEWIHYGGDEVHFANKQWVDDKFVRALMREEGYENILQVEHHFNRQMADYISSLGKTTVGWDEIVNAGVPPDQAVIMWWRHDKPQQRDKAIERGYRVIICPRRPYYFDFVQHESHKEGRRWGGFCPLDMVYAHPRIPDSYSKSDVGRIMGVQANLWTEKVGSPDRLEFMSFPRMAGLAEAAWTMPEAKNYDEFADRLKQQLKRYRLWGLSYFNPFNPEQTPEIK